MTEDVRTIRPGEGHPIELLSRHLDGELTRDQERRLHTHLARCASCRRERARLRRICAALDDPSPVACPPRFLETLERRIDVHRCVERPVRGVRRRFGVKAAVVSALATAAMLLLWPTTPEAPRPLAGVRPTAIEPLAAPAGASTASSVTDRSVAPDGVARAVDGGRSPLLAWTVRPRKLSVDAVASRIVDVAAGMTGVRVIERRAAAIEVLVPTSRLPELRASLWRFGSLETPPVEIAAGTRQVLLELRISPIPIDRVVRPRSRLPG